MMRFGKALRHAGPALALMISACATTPTPAPTSLPDRPPETEESSEPTSPEPPDTVQAPAQPKSDACAWSNIRGIATLLAIATQPPHRNGTWQFFPGDDVVFHAIPDNAHRGDEFKALLRRPMSGPCQQPQLVLFGPV